jgi:hypothetical protein
MRWAVKLIIVSLLTSCSATWHLSRAIKKDPTILEKDTLVVKDTVVVPPVVITDTVTTRQHDTIVVQKDRLRVRIVKRLDTLIIEGECASDTIVRTIEVPYETITYVERRTIGQKIQGLVFYFGLVLLALYILRRLIDKVFNG